MRQHLHSCIDSNTRQLRVKMQRLTKEQVLNLKSPQKQNVSGHVSATRAADKTQEIQPSAVSNFTCDVSGCNFSGTFEKLQFHKIHVHPGTVLTCQLCGKVYKIYQNFHAHMNSHKTATDGVLKCLLAGCNQTVVDTNFKKHFAEHKQLFEMKPTHECNYCGTFLWTKAHLKSHVDKHFSVRPGYLNCVFDLCRKLFDNGEAMKKHMAKHEKTLPQFKCPKCSKCFYSREQLRQHKMYCSASLKKAPKQSADDSAMVCKYCGSTFMTLWHFNGHLKKHEMEPTGVFTCLRVKCKKICGSAIEMQKHEKTHKRKKFTCDLCGRFYVNKVVLKLHMVRHFEERSLPCDVPGCSYAGKVKMDIHLHKQNVHNNPGVNCNLCGKLVRQK